MSIHHFIFRLLNDIRTAVGHELQIGKLSGKSAYGAYRALSGTNKWQWLSWTNLLCVLIIMIFYFVVTGWCLYYMVEATSNTFAAMDAKALEAHFDAFETQALVMITYAIIGILLTASVLWFDDSETFSLQVERIADMEVEKQKLVVPFDIYNDRLFHIRLC